ncbi:MAG: hypothetical protein RMY34_06470 [Aulosira sp. DedQUE10]|nr:hypothetical protein [Aulosira sp. DedQUE10]
MQFRLQYSTEARDALNNLEQTDPKKYQKVAKTLALIDPHKFTGGFKEFFHITVNNF